MLKRTFSKWTRFLLFSLLIYIILYAWARIYIYFSHHERPYSSSSSSPNSNSNSKPIPYSPFNRKSTIQCKNIAKTCLLKNLYFINGELHAYFGPSFVENEWDGIRLFTGIGFGTGVIELKSGSNTSSSSYLYTSLKDFAEPVGNRTEFWEEAVASPEESLNSTTNTIDSGETTATESDSSIVNNKPGIKSLNTRTFRIPVFLHAKEPPHFSELPKGMLHYLEPTVFFSVMWPNLFRTVRDI
jgi:hypothetical protein